MNAVLDYNKLQGTTHPSDLMNRPPRDINFRYITIQNSSYRPIGIAITNRGFEFYYEPAPEIRFVLKGREIRHVGINNQGGPDQFLWMIDPESKKPVGNPRILDRYTNDFVLRDGGNMWYVDRFRRPSYFPQH